MVVRLFLSLCMITAVVTLTGAQTNAPNRQAVPSRIVVTAKTFLIHDGPEARLSKTTLELPGSRIITADEAEYFPDTDVLVLRGTATVRSEVNFFR